MNLPTVGIRVVNDHIDAIHCPPLILESIGETVDERLRVVQSAPASGCLQLGQEDALAVVAHQLPFAARAIDTGHQTSVWNRTPGGAALVAGGAAEADSPSTASEDANAVS